MSNKESIVFAKDDIEGLEEAAETASPTPAERKSGVYPGQEGKPSGGDSRNPLTSKELKSMADFGAALPRAIQSAGLTQAQAGDQIGCSQSLVSRMLRGVPVSSTTMESARRWASRIFGPGAATADRQDLVEEEDEAMRMRSGQSSAGDQALSPYEAILRGLLEEVAQQRLEELAGDAAEGVSVRVTLEWEDPS